MPSHISIPGKNINPAILDERFKESLDQLSKTNVADVQKIVASQLDIMRVYHSIVQEQAKKSFRWALVAAGFGLFFFFIAVGAILFRGQENVATIGVISGALIEVISGINFYLYGRTSLQLANFQSRLDITQRFLLANSVCEGLTGEIRQQTRAKLVDAISNVAQNNLGFEKASQ